jgi:23S rRNA (cytidine1920-2'-O)/16S rRNA (cytidine1409-2'-O)-methyltransferase
MDIGASTGGFTDCLLKKGASRVISVDVAYGKLDMKLRNDSRVLMLERTHACSLFPSQLPPAFSDPKVFTVDVSFISSERILYHLAKAFASLQMGILLYKPQFELERSLIGKGGLVRDPQCIPQHIQDWKSRLLKQGWQAPKSDEISPIAGYKCGNLEYLVYLDRTTPC